MFKHLVLVAAVGAACAAFGVHAGEWKESIDATWHPPQLAGIGSPIQSPGLSAPFGSIASDLDLDATFANEGLARYYLDNEDGLEGWGLRVFARPGNAGWYVLGKHGHGNGTWDAVVIAVRPDGNLDTQYLVPTPMFRLDDATLDTVTGKFYFVGGAKQAGHADSDFAVTCMDITLGATGGTCAGFGDGGTGTRHVAFNRGGNNDDVARRVVVRPNIGLVLAGWAKDATDRYVIAATALYRDGGGLVPRFGSGGKFTTDLGSNLGNLDVNVYDIALSNDPDTEARLYIAGNRSYDTARTDYDGVVLALNAWTGTVDTAFGSSGIADVRLDLGDPAIDRSDAVTAMTVLANGKLALAGWSMDETQNRLMMIAELDANGAYNGHFCSGTALCAPFAGEATGQRAHYWPTAIAERPDTRDLVIAMEYAVLGGAAVGQITQIASQWSATGDLRAAKLFDYGAGGGQIPYSVPAGMLVNADAAMIVGTRRFSTVDSDYDVTLIRTLTNDSLFADTFGGPASD